MATPAYGLQLAETENMGFISDAVSLQLRVNVNVNINSFISAAIYSQIVTVAGLGIV